MGNPHAKIETSVRMLPQMPKCIYSAVGNKRRLFRDAFKEKANHYSPLRKDT